MEKSSSFMDSNLTVEELAEGMVSLEMVKFSGWQLSIAKFLGFSGITTPTQIFIDRKKTDSDEWLKLMVAHELVHLMQFLHEGIIKFYFMYCFHFVRNYFRYWDWLTAYKAIPYEVEAYTLQRDPEFYKLGSLIVDLLEREENGVK